MFENSEILMRLQGPLTASDPRHRPPPFPITSPCTKTSGATSRVTPSGGSSTTTTLSIFFDNQRGGFFVEAGALDGEFLSNTLWLETALGWTGLLIEADQNNYRHLAWKRRRAWISNTCITKEEYPREAVFEVLTKASKFPTWLYHANTREINTHNSLLHDEMSNSSERAYAKAQCFPLTSYLLALNVTLIDFLSLTSRGHEWAVLRSLPLDRLRVRSLAVEHLAAPNATRGGWSFDMAFVRYMGEVGYHLVDVYKDIDYFLCLAE
ncbi:LOW QUALITY PROTEIN: protein Star-like [Scylla paramamosain]|uniref:LOW QUALITY PROTEIN: protein Star-like n=1 Tax=Scylla paramamosain TaxID=85552 RepID=UPI00308270C3